MGGIKIYDDNGAPITSFLLIYACMGYVTPILDKKFHIDVFELSCYCIRLEEVVICWIISESKFWSYFCDKLADSQCFTVPLSMPVLAMHLIGRCRW